MFPETPSTQDESADQLSEASMATGNVEQRIIYKLKTIDE